MKVSITIKTKQSATRETRYDYIFIFGLLCYAVGLWPVAKNGCGNGSDISTF